MGQQMGFVLTRVGPDFGVTSGSVAPASSGGSIEIEFAAGVRMRITGAVCGALLDQLELQLADLEENAAQAETVGQMAAAEMIAMVPFERRKPARRSLPEHLPRERIVYLAIGNRPCCGDNRLRKRGENVTESWS